MFWNQKKSFSERKRWRRGYSFYRGGEKRESPPKVASTWLNRKAFPTRRPLKTLKKLVLRGVVALGISGGFFVAFYFFFSGAYRITDIQISGRQNISEYAIRRVIDEQLTKRRFLIFPENNLFWFRKSEAERDIRESYVLEGLKIEKKFPHTLQVEIQEKVSTLVWVTKQGDIERYYYLDLHGIVLGEIPEEEVEQFFLKDKKLDQAGGESVVEVKDLASQGQDAAPAEPAAGEHEALFPVIHDVSGLSARVQDQVLDEKTVQFIVDVSLKFPEKFPNIPIKYFATLEPMSSRVQAVAEEGWEIYFEAEKDLDAQLNNLSLVLKQKIKDTKKLQYIDLRFDERIYYK